MPSVPGCLQVWEVKLQIIYLDIYSSSRHRSGQLRACATGVRARQWRASQCRRPVCTISTQSVQLWRPLWRVGRPRHLPYKLRRLAEQTDQQVQEHCDCSLGRKLQVWWNMSDLNRLCCTEAFTALYNLLHLYSPDGTSLLDLYLLTLKHQH